MKNLTKAVILSAAVALTSQVSQAQFFLGFTSGTAANDYIINLGDLSTFSTTAITDLSGLVSLSQFGSGGVTPVATASAGAVFAKSAIGTVVGDAGAVTLARTGNNALGTQGTESAQAQVSGGSISSATSEISLLSAGVVSAGTIASPNTSSFTYQGSAVAAGSVAQDLNATASHVMVGGKITEDVFSATRTSAATRGTTSTPFGFIGSLLIDLSGSSPVVEYIPAGFSAAVPEPATYGLIAGAGLLLLSLRRQLGRVIA